MTLSLTWALLPLLAVTMVTTAAPLSEQATGDEMAVAANGDGNTVDVAKRAKEIIAFGNQQNSARLGAAKKSVDPSQDHLPPLLPQETAPKDDSTAGDEIAEKDKQLVQPSSEGSKEGSEEELQQAGLSGDVQEGEATPEQQPGAEGVQEAEIPDQTESRETENTNINEPRQSLQALQQTSREGGANEGGDENHEEQAAQPVPVEGGEHPEKVQEEEQQQGQRADSINPDLPSPSELEEGGVHPVNEKERMAAEAGNSMNTDSASDEDEVESLLTDLQHSNSVQGGGNDEGSAERELMQVTNQKDGNAGRSGSSSNGDGEGVIGRGGEVPQNLLNYILSQGVQYGRRLPYPVDPYFLQRARRSLKARSHYGVPHMNRHLGRPGSRNIASKIHNGGMGGVEKELSRAKRTKRDLFDDGLYYNPVAESREFNNENPLLEREEEVEGEAEKDAELQELIAYLTALYPALYGDGDSANFLAQFPGYLWQGPTYPEALEDLNDGAERESYLLEPSRYQEPQVGWEEPELQPAPAWEPSFYPEEEKEEEEEEAEEVPDLYQALVKRQMMSFVPGERRKRYFFPFAREPYTHWGAFVPSQKRGGYYKEQQEEEAEEEEDPYRRLRELAMILAEEDRQPSSSGYFDTVKEYKKK